jgi:enhancer of polycomb-like protein
MTTEDDVFLTKYNEKRPNGSKCPEDDFEKIMDAFEEESQIQAPFASVDGTVTKFEDLQGAVKQALDDKAFAFAQDIYAHWRDRKQAAGKLPLQPRLKEEKDPTKDEGDPYICFRRRDARQTRKTRARDNLSVDKLKKLRKEIEEGRQLIAMAFQREQAKREMLHVDKSIFQMRAELKRNKIKLGIKTDDEDLINQKVCRTPTSYVDDAHLEQPQKRKPQTDYPQVQRPPGPPLRMPGRADGRPLEADLIQLSDVLAQKENLLQQEIEEKAEQHRKWNHNHIDLTREPLLPVLGQGPETGFRPATAQYQYLMTPPSSVTSESFDHLSPSHEKPEPFMTRYNSPPEEDEPHGQPAYRRRIGRCNRLWIDRRGMSAASQALDASVSDRWKYDQDDDDEQPVYEVDPYDTKALRFRATIPLPPSTFSQRSRQEERSAQQVRINSAPANQRAITAAAQQPQTAPT